MSSKEKGQTKMEWVVENWNSHSYLKIKASDGEKKWKKSEVLGKRCRWAAEP